MDIAVFGAGQVGRDMMPALERDYNIDYYVDNDKRLWGTRIGEYLIQPPQELVYYQGNIVIASIQYTMELIKQLLGMGISAERIFFCYKFQAENFQCRVYPVLAERYQSPKIPLIQFDLLEENEEKMVRKKVLVACLLYSVYTKQLIENLSGRYEDVEFSLLTQAKEYRENIKSGKLKHIYCFGSLAELKTILEQLPVYDVMQFLWIEFEWSYFYQVIRAKTKRLNLNVGGSDFYRAKKDEREFKRKLIACADTITAETRETVSEFEAYYGTDLKRPVGLLPFGVEVLGYIRKYRDVPEEQLRGEFNLPLGKLVVTCGHNALEVHQHMKIIKALSCLSEEVKQQAVFVFPMTYPKCADGYVEDVKNKLESVGISYVVLTEFMDFQRMAQYALISDIMIHVQLTDQLSSSMLEEMYANSVVIAGSWLPYRSLHEMGLYFLDVDSIPDVTGILEDVVRDIGSYRQKCEGNPQIIWDHSSWDGLSPKWHALWE
ncbi:MAG: glycosyltransferase family 4 protein [Lachnospiraceae bacterium]|nr:glycosyltransferase family 4 protein [Lachnospiraceae bacterium]